MPRLLSDWLRSYTAYMAYTEAPSTFNFWTGVWTIASAMRRKTFFNMGNFQWTPNFYIIFVAKPGIATKSTTAGQGMVLLEQVPGIVIGPSSLTWQALPMVLEQAAEGVEMPDGMIHTMSCVSFFSSELGNLIDPEDKRMIDLLTDLWDGRIGKWSRVTKTTGRNDAVNPWLNILACVTPSWLADNVPHSIIGGGFTSRCVFIYESAKSKLVAYPKHARNGNHEGVFQELLHDLMEIATLKGEFEMTQEAYTLGTEWYQYHWDNPPKNLASIDMFQGYLSRKQGHIHKLAMVVSAAKTNELLISAEVLQLAINIMDSIEEHMPFVLSSITTTKEQSIVEDIIQMVQFHKEIPRILLYQHFIKRMNYKAFTEALESGINAGLIAQTNEMGQLILKGVRRKESE